MGKEECNMAFKEPLRTFAASFISGLAVLVFMFLLFHESQSDLYSRIVLGGNDALNTYISRGYDVNKKFDDKTLLDAAVQNDNWYMVGKLLEKGANVNSTDHNSVTPLMRASLNSSSAIVKLLLNHGADPTKQDDGGANAVSFAATGNPESIYLLAKAGANINNVSKDGQTPLLTAVAHYEETKNGYISVVTLLSLGANVDCTNKENATPIGLADQHGDTNLLQLFHKYAKVSKRVTH